MYKIFLPIHKISLQCLELCSVNIRYKFVSNIFHKLNSINLAAIGNVSPNREIWRFSISLITIPRLVMAWMYWTYLRDITYKLDYIKTMINIATVLHLCELTSLLLLSFFDSNSRTFVIHKIAFGSFAAFSLLYFYVHCYLFR